MSYSSANFWILLMALLGTITVPANAAEQDRAAGSSAGTEFAFEGNPFSTEPPLSPVANPVVPAGFLSFEAKSRPIAQASAETQASTKTLDETAASTATVVSRATNAQEQRDIAREEWRESLMKQSQDGESDRDSLTAELFSVVRWTIVALVVTGICAFGLKKVPAFNRPPVAGARMTIVESLSLGRHQVLNLVQAGGERFLVASDPGGIRAVTLLPNWPSHPEDADLTGPQIQIPSATTEFFPSRVA